MATRDAQLMRRQCAASCACVQAVADIIRTTLGPRSMLKMLLDASGGTRGVAWCGAPGL